MGFALEATKETPKSGSEYSKERLLGVFLLYQQLRYKSTIILNISVLSNTGIQLKMMMLWKSRVGKVENWLKKWVDIVLVVVYNGRC